MRKNELFSVFVLQTKIFIDKTMNKSPELKSTKDVEFADQNCFINIFLANEQHHIDVYTPKTWKQKDHEYFQEQLAHLDAFGRQRIVAFYAQNSDWTERHKFVVNEIINSNMRTQLATAPATLHQPEIDEEDEI